MLVRGQLRNPNFGKHFKRILFMLILNYSEGKASKSNVWQYLTRIQKNDLFFLNLGHPDRETPLIMKIDHRAYHLGGVLVLEQRIA